MDGSDRSEWAKPPIDILVNVPDLALVAGRSGLVEKVSTQRAPNLADVPPSFIDIVDGYGSVFTYGCWGYATTSG